MFTRMAMTGAAVLLTCAISASAADVSFSSAQGSRAASASFEISGNDLIVTLSNTSASDALVPTDVLTGVFFDISGGSFSLTPMSAIVPVGSVVVNGTTDPGNAVGGEWAYRSGLSGAPGGTSYGLSSTGLGLFGPGDLFPGTNLQGPSSPDGLQYGLAPAGDDPMTGNMPLTNGSNALIRNSVVFTLTGLPTGFDPSTQIHNVQYQYGTDLSEPHIPEPASALLLGIGGLAVFRRKR